MFIFIPLCALRRAFKSKVEYAFYSTLYPSARCGAHSNQKLNTHFIQPYTPLRAAARIQIKS
jgi:hypothetical protein